MSGDLMNEITRIREQLRQSESAGQRESDLSSKREDLENSIRRLTAEIEQDHRQLHSQKQARPSLEQHIDKQMQLLRQLKQKLKEIDHWLDDFEEGESTSLEDLEKTLAQHLLELHPDERERYQTLVRQKQVCQDMHRNLEQLLSYGNDLSQFLSRAIAEGQRVKRGGIMRFVMGTNPNKVILACLDGVEKTAKQALLTLQKCGQAEASVGLQPSTYQALEEHLTSLMNHSRANWNYGVLARQYPAHLESLRIQLESVEQRHVEALHHYRQKEKQLRAWLLDQPV